MTAFAGRLVPIRFGGDYLPFLDQFLPLIDSGRKTATARTFPLSVGKTYRLKNGRRIRVTKRERMPLGDVPKLHLHEEGMDSESEFWAIWKQLHTRKPFDPARKVYFHTFEKVTS